MDRPFDALREALRVAPTIVLLEPNGYNMGLKLIEKPLGITWRTAKNRTPRRRLDRFARQLGAKAIYRDFCCLVPYFSPDWFAKAIKRLEPTRLNHSP